MEVKDAQKALRGVNCLDSIEINIKDGLFYKIEEYEEFIKVYAKWKKNYHPGWIPLKIAKGEYCGQTPIIDNDFFLKIRVKDPFSMTRLDENYLRLPVSNLNSINAYHHEYLLKV